MVKAAVFHEYGPPSVMKYEDVGEVPPPGEDELRIKHTAIGVNYLDCYIRQGREQFNAGTKLPGHITGIEGAGEITAVGRGVSKDEFDVGDHVVYISTITEQGAYAAERNLLKDRCINLSRLRPKSDVSGVDDDTAAAGLLKGMTVYMLLFHAYPVKQGQWILVHAAAGGVGSLMTQWAKKIGVRVIGTVGSVEKAERARSNGCDHVIVYTSEDVVEGVKKATNGEMCSVVYDSVGKDTVKASLESLQDNGTLVIYGAASGPADPNDLREEYLKRRGIRHFWAGLYEYTKTRPQFVEFAQATLNELGSGNIRLAEIRKFPLAEASKAHEFMEQRRNIGSALLVP